MSGHSQFTFEDFQESRRSVVKFLNYDFRADKGMELARFGRWFEGNLKAYDEARDDIKDYWGVIDPRTGELKNREQPWVTEDGKEVMRPIPNTFQVSDQEAFDEEVKLLNSTIVNGNGFYITEKHVDAVRPPRGASKEEVAISPAVIAGLGVFFDWGDEGDPGALKDSPADEAMEAIRKRREMRAKSQDPDHVED